MSERWGKCHYCNGTGQMLLDQQVEFITLRGNIDCILCNGSGNASDAIIYLQQQIDKEWENERPDDTRWEWM